MNYKRLTTVLAILLVTASSNQAARAQVVVRSGGAAGQKNQGPRKLDDKPMARVWYSKISAMGWGQYNSKVAREMGIQGGASFSIGGPTSPNPEPPPKQELKGMLVYLVKGLVPAPVNIEFRKVDDHAAFMKEVLARKSQWSFAAEAKLSGRENKYKLEVDVAQMTQLPRPPKGDDGKEGEGETRSVAISVRIGGPPGGAAVDDDSADPGAGLLPTTMTTYFRFKDGVMFESTAPELHDMKLPVPKDLALRGKEAALDLYADVDLTRIPTAYRRVFWKTAEVQANSLLQQMDDETDEIYAVRKRGGELSMAITKAAMLDVDRVQVSLSFAKGDEPLKLNVIADARKNSNLMKQLGQVSRGVSRFESLRRKRSPLTIASAWQMPEGMRKLLGAMFARGRTQLQDELTDDGEALLAVEDLFEVLSDTAKTGAADAIVKLGGDADSGFALYGGLRISDAKELKTHLSTLLSRLPATPENDIHVTRADGREFLSFRLDEAELPLVGENEQLPAQLHFTVAESCLWFSAGGPNSYDVLKECLADYQAEGRTKRAKPTAPFVLDAHLGDWLKAEGQTAESQFSAIPSKALDKFERELHRTLSGMFSFQTTNAQGAQSKPTMEFRNSYLAKAFEAGRDDLHVEIDTSATRVRASVEVGEGILRFFVARWSDVQSRLFEGLDFEALEKEAREKGIIGTQREKQADGKK